MATIGNVNSVPTAPAATNLFDIRDPRHSTIPNTILNDPKNKHLKVITAGAGVAGIMNSYNIEKYCENIAHVVYEKNADIGGTWFENRYPGCACDVPSHAYAFHFAPNPDWPRFLSKREDIWAYLDRVCRVFDLRKYMDFNVEIVGATWDEDAAQWRIKARRTLPDNTTEEFEDRCDIFLYATGLLNNWQWPKIDGFESFQGRIIHSARWPSEYYEEQWKGQRVAVIGSGASSLQIVPSMQPYVGGLDIFVRTGVWFAPLIPGYDERHTYTDEEITQFRNDPQKLIDHVRSLDAFLNRGWPAFINGSEAQAQMRAEIEQRMSEIIKDERLLKGFTPKFAVGCRRITPGEPYLKAIQKENVQVHFTPVVKIVPEGVVGGDGVTRVVDSIICATGFDVSFTPRFPIIGRNGVALAERWRDEPNAYFGVTVPDMPNLVMQGGPPTPVQNGTPFGAFHAHANYALQVIKKMQRDNIRLLQPKRTVTEAFNRHAQDYLMNTVFADSCRAWYKNNETGRITAIWPGSALQYKELLDSARWEDYEIEYRDKDNMFAFLGNGLVKEHVNPELDITYYLDVSNIDPKWLKEVQGQK